jgi:DNA adenine methylase
MKQLPLPFTVSIDTVINTASVPHRSPFRYPGGKTWFVPRLRQWLHSANKPIRALIEPFAGGASIGLSAIFERLVEHVVLVELDAGVAAVWQTVLSPSGAAYLCEKIMSFEMIPSQVDTILHQQPSELHDLAFQTILKNRVNRGGILAAGAGRVKQGENGRGLSSRWYPETLSRRIADICAHRHAITFIHGDGVAVLRAQRDEKELVFFIDPPYTPDSNSPGKRLYTHHQLDHEALFSLTETLRGDFLMTYNKHPNIEQHIEKARFQSRAIAMKNTHHAIQSELVIGRDLSWLSD